MSPNEETQNQDAGSKTATTQPKESLKSICQRSLDSLFDWLAEMRVPIILGLLCLFLYQPIEELAIKRLIAPVLAHFNTGWLSSIVALVLAVILALRLIQLVRRRYIVGGKFVLSAGLILPAYLYYRLGPPDFEFYGLFGQTWTFAFADLIPIACVVPLFLWIRALCTKRRANQERQAPKSVQGFLTDHPLTEEEEELSGWTSQAQTLTQKLLATDTTRAAFSLGIVASWGEGKSSFMGIMQRYLQQAQREVIVMRFNPWLYDKEAQLTKVFFEELRRTLAPYSSKLSRSIDNYADLLLAVDSSWLKFAHQLLRLSQRSTTEQFDKLSRDIKELGRRVVIFIDDVDRLTREELMELFNLVRNSSNLPCLYFVLAYDKSYVLKTLQGDGEHMTRYPEKILQEEYPLPKLAPDKMWTVLERCLRETQFGKESEEKKQRAKDNQTTNKENKVSTLLGELKKEGVNLPYHLTTIRMVKRIVNAFNSRYELLHKVGVAPFDLFIFELIYYVYPSVYDFLLEMHKEALASLNASLVERRPYSTYSLCPIFFSHTNGEGMQYISLHPEGEKRSWATPEGDKNEGQASSALSNEASGNTYPVVDTLKELYLGLENGYKKDIVVGNIVKLLDLLWGKDRKPALRQINYETYWRRYFYRGLQVGELSQEEFASFLANLDRAERKQCLERWCQEKPIAFIQEVLGYTRMNEGELETIVYAMLDWNSLSSVDTPFNYEEIDLLIRRAAPTDDWKKEEFPKILQDKDVLRATFDYTVGWLQAVFNEAAILSTDSLHAIQEAIFKKIAEKENCINLYTRYWLRAGEHKAYGKFWTTPGLDECMRKHIIEEGIEQFSKYILSRTQVHGGSLYRLHDIPWYNLTELAEDVKKHSQDKGKNSFLRFVELALEEEQRLAQEDRLDFDTEWRVKLTLSPEQWKPKEEPNFPLRTDDADGNKYPFISYPPEKK
nr:P-loop NTPase fold protein [uncultured Porphyromonas sp.]